MAGQLPGEWWGFVLLGIGAGIVSGLLGVGSGTVVIPALVLLWGFGQKSAQGMALAAMVPMALIGALRYWRNPDVELNGPVIALIVLGAVAGTMVGTELVARLPAGLLRKAFAVFLAVVAVRMFTAAPRAEKPNLSIHAGANNHSPLPEAVDTGDTNDRAAQHGDK
ncbi:MAG: sulfite exporter TauE/SafE family protein [Planctomycetes bacterium]|nr:sulfite exporter TauE/SafE family protein [Planctomycetota bacterium]